MGYRPRRMNNAVSHLTVFPVARDAILEFQAGQSLVERNRHAFADVRDGLSLWRLASTLGWLDIRLRYRGSMLGPLWLTISTGVMVATLGFLYAKLFNMDIQEYLPFLALSQVLWGFLATVVAESCGTFTDMVGLIRSVRMPMFVFSLRVVVRNILVLAHNVIVFVVVFAIFRIWPGWHLLLVAPGLVLWVCNALALTLLFGGLCARFRDIPPIVNSVMQIAFFLTPVLWKPSQLGNGQVYLPLNPFYDLLEIVRAPMLGEAVSALTWGGAILFSCLLWVFSWMFFIHARGRVAFWV
jgi:lipopolysaccharide transport system permease protein